MKHQLNEIERMQQLSGILKEGKLVTVSLYALRESGDGNFHGVIPQVYIEADSYEKAKKLADEYTKGQFTKHGGFYDLSKAEIKVYK